jgi:hypothetical protein
MITVNGLYPASDSQIEGMIGYLADILGLNTTYDGKPKHYSLEDITITIEDLLEERDRLEERIKTYERREADALQTGESGRNADTERQEG